MKITVDIEKRQIMDGEFVKLTFFREGKRFSELTISSELLYESINAHLRNFKDASTGRIVGDLADILK